MTTIPELFDVQPELENLVSH